MRRWLQTAELASGHPRLSGQWDNKAAAHHPSFPFKLCTTPSAHPPSSWLSSEGHLAQGTGRKKPGSSVLNCSHGEASCPAQAWAHTCQEII